MTQNRHSNDQNFFIPAFLSVRKNQYLVTAGLMILFALLGLVAGSFVNFPYEAEAVLITNLELVEDTNVTELMVYTQLELVRQLMFHPDITDHVLLVEQEAGNPITLHELKDKSVIERRLTSTLIKVRDTDPQIAARIATTWAEAAYKRLSEAYEHAVLVSEAKWVITSTEQCLTDKKVFTTAFCQSLTLDAVEEKTNTAQQIILAESPYSLGLTKDLQISQYQPAAIPTEPIQGGQANLMLIGALIGLVASLILYELPWNNPAKEAE